MSLYGFTSHGISENLLLRSHFTELTPLSPQHQRGSFFLISYLIGESILESWFKFHLSSLIASNYLVEVVPITT